MIRGGNEHTDLSLGLGPHLVGKQIVIQGRSFEICEQLGEGGFSFVYLVRNNAAPIGNFDGESPHHLTGHSLKSIAEIDRNSPSLQPPFGTHMVLKLTSVHNASQRHMAEKEAKLLQTLSHPSIVQVYGHGFRENHGGDESNPRGDASSLLLGRNEVPNIASNLNSTTDHLVLSSKLAQHLILMEYCEGGTAFDAIKRMKLSSESIALSSEPNHGNLSQRFDLPSLVISFGQICNAVSYLHAQRPPIIHRDLKPVNFLIKNGAYKLCDFGSAVMGHTDLRTPESRRKAEEVINKTTTQMFRAPEMVDLYMANRLTQSTDVWALGCCLYSLAFLCDCFEEGSNLAILSRKYKIPDDNPYGDGLVDLIDRMLTGDYKERADMSEVIMCLSALYSNRPLPKRKQKYEEEREGHRLGAYRTDGQGIHRRSSAKKKMAEAKKLDPNSAAAKRKKAFEGHRRNENKLPAQVIYNSNSKSAINLSSRSSLDGSCQNFASFDRVFEGYLGDDVSSRLDSAGAKTENLIFPSIFDERCQISVASSPQAATNGTRGLVDGTYEVAYQGVPRKSLANTPSHSYCYESCRSPRNVTVSPSILPAFESNDLHSVDHPIASGKKKRGIIGIIGKGSAKKFLP